MRRTWLEQQEAHHGACIAQREGVRITPQHGALNPACIKVQRNDLVILYDHRPARLPLSFHVSDRKVPVQGL
jgi:hypothetical protein